MRWALAPFLCLALAGCAGGTRWIEAQVDRVEIEGYTYTVQFIRDGSAAVDVQVNARIGLAMDNLIELRRKTAAAEAIARKVCAARRVTMESHAPAAANDHEQFRYRCA